MEHVAMDRRSLKTRNALLAAFRDLLLERGYAALQVGDVCNLANVGRSTFYAHFPSRVALLRASLTTPFSQLADLVLPAAQPWQIIPWLQHFREHQQVVRTLLGWPTRPVLSQVLTAMIAARLAPQQAVTARLIADAQLALLDIWILGRPVCTVEAAAGILYRSGAALAAASTAP